MKYQTPFSEIEKKEIGSKCSCPYGCCTSEACVRYVGENGLDVIFALIHTYKGLK